MKRLHVAATATALVILAVAAVTPIGQATVDAVTPFARNSDRIDGLHASKAPRAGQLIALDRNAKLPASVLRVKSGAKGDTGAQGAAGPQGAKGDTGAQGPAGPQGAKGDTGAQGPAGPQGPKGDTGPQGAPGQVAVTYAWSDWVTVRANQTGFAEALCPTGAIALGEAHHTASTADRVAVLASDPIASPDGRVGWYLFLENTGDTDAQFIMHAICFHNVKVVGVTTP
jgi:hypothetical protein